MLEIEFSVYKYQLWNLYKGVHGSLRECMNLGDILDDKCHLFNLLIVFSSATVFFHLSPCTVINLILFTFWCTDIDFLPVRI